MTDLPPPASPPETPSGRAKLGLTDPSANPALAKTPKTRRSTLVIVGIVLMGACLCVCSCLAVLAAYGNYILTERPRVEHLIEEFMEAMVAQDLDTAYALFSPRARTVWAWNGLQGMLADYNDALFKNYRAVTVERFVVSLSDSPSLDMGQVVMATVEGRVIYSDDFTGQYQATVERVGDDWALVHISIAGPPNKTSP